MWGGHLDRGVEFLISFLSHGLWASCLAPCGPRSLCSSGPCHLGYPKALLPAFFCSSCLLSTGGSHLAYGIALPFFLRSCCQVFAPLSGSL